MVIDEPSQPSASSNSEGFSYSVKIINPAKKADYSIRKFRVNTLFKTVISLKKALCESFLTSSASDVEVGYITKGHGARGILWFYTNNKTEEGSKKGKKTNSLTWRN